MQILNSPVRFGQRPDNSQAVLQTVNTALRPEFEGQYEILKRIKQTGTQSTPGLYIQAQNEGVAERIFNRLAQLPGARVIEHPAKSSPGGIEVPAWKAIELGGAQITVEKKREFPKFPKPSLPPFDF